MNKINCEVIRDLLPLYVDDAASQKTRELVQEHLNNCSNCREDLRLMRSQVSLPVDEDTELVLKKFRERREQRARKKKIAIISAVSAVMLIIMFCVSFSLWYTRPRSWAELTGLIDEPDIVTGHCLTYDFMGADPGFISWKLEEADGADPIAHQILNELNAASYRASLRNLTDRIPLLEKISANYSTRGVGYVSVFVRSKDCQTGISVDLYSNGEIRLLVNSPSSSTGFVTYRTDASLYDALANAVREYGVRSEIKSAGTTN